MIYLMTWFQGGALETVGIHTENLRLEIPLPENIRDILSRLADNKFKAYIVGGAVRDALHEYYLEQATEVSEKRIPSKCRDFDILTNASLEQVKSLFAGNQIQDNKVKIAGKAFPVCLVNNVEVATARNSEKNNAFPHNDLEHRDLTINAMAWDPSTMSVVDPFDGTGDLKNKTICFTGNPEHRIKEDPVRMVRACRFAAMLQGKISPGSVKTIRTLRYLLDDTAKERLNAEIVKAMACEKPSLFFIAMRETGLLEYVFPSLDRCYELDGGPHHGETVFEHCMLVGDALPSSLPVLRLAGFLHDTGKVDAAKVKDGKLTFAGHEKHLEAVEKDLSDLKYSNRDMGYILSVISAHMRPLTDQTTPRAARRLLAMLEEKGLDYKDFMRIRIADKRGNLKKTPYTIDQIKQRLRILFNELKSENAFSINQLAISGDDIIELIGLCQGPEIGQVKKMLFEKVLDDPSLNSREKLIEICRSLKIEK